MIGFTFHAQDIQLENVDGGPISSGAWMDRRLNTVTYNSLYGASLATNQITLQPGIYEVESKNPAYKVDRHQSRLLNENDSSVAIYGTPAFSNESDGIVTDSFIRGTITLSEVTVFSVQHRVQTTNSTANGLGIGAGFSDNEIFTDISFKKIG